MLRRLVTRVSKKPEGLLGRLKNLVVAAELAAASSQSINPRPRTKSIQESKGKGSAAAAPAAKGKAADTALGKTAKGKTNSQNLGKSAGSVPVSGTWTLVGRKGQPARKDIPDKLKLREMDWPGTVVVQSARMFGTLVDKHGYKSPYCVIANNHFRDHSRGYG